MKFESHWPKGSGKVSFKANYSGFLFLALAAILFIEANHFSYFVRGSPNQHSYEV